MATPAENLEREDKIQGVGCSRKRKEDPRFIQGKGNYVHWMPTLAGDVQAVLADEKVHFQMQEVAVVVADNRYIAADAVDLSVVASATRSGSIPAMSPPSWPPSSWGDR